MLWTLLICLTPQPWLPACSCPFLPSSSQTWSVPGSCFPALLQVPAPITYPGCWLQLWPLAWYLTVSPSLTLELAPRSDPSLGSMLLTLTIRPDHPHLVPRGRLQNPERIHDIYLLVRHVAPWCSWVYVTAKVASAYDHHWVHGCKQLRILKKSVKHVAIYISVSEKWDWALNEDRNEAVFCC